MAIGEPVQGQLVQNYSNPSANLATGIQLGQKMIALDNEKSKIANDKQKLLQQKISNNVQIFNAMNSALKTASDLPKSAVKPYFKQMNEQFSQVGIKFDDAFISSFQDREWATNFLGILGKATQDPMLAAEGTQQFINGSSQNDIMSAINKFYDASKSMEELKKRQEFEQKKTEFVQGETTKRADKALTEQKRKLKITNIKDFSKKVTDLDKSFRQQEQAATKLKSVISATLKDVKPGQTYLTNPQDGIAIVKLAQQMMEVSVNQVREGEFDLSANQRSYLDMLKVHWNRIYNSGSTIPVSVIKDIAKTAANLQDGFIIEKAKDIEVIKQLGSQIDLTPEAMNKLIGKRNQAILNNVESARKRINERSQQVIENGKKQDQQEQAKTQPSQQAPRTIQQMRGTFNEDQIQKSIDKLNAARKQKGLPELSEIEINNIKNHLGQPKQ